MLQGKRFSLTAAATVLLALPCAAAERPESEAAQSQQAVARLIADLDSNKYAVRLRASTKLSFIGRPAVAPLTEAAEKGSLEVAIRAISVLEVFFIGEKEALAEEAESALEHLAVSKNRAVARRAESVLAAHQDLRQERALAAFLRLGGTQRPMLRARKNELPFLLQIGAGWKGGDEGLKYVKRMPTLKYLYQIDGNNVSKEGWEDLRDAMPQLEILRRGSAFLGIARDEAFITRVGCPVAEVKPESAAAKAGMLPRDVITSFGGKKVRDFDTLIELIKQKRAGDKVAVQVLRNGKPITLQVVLGEWK